MLFHILTLVTNNEVKLVVTIEEKSSFGTRPKQESFRTVMYIGKASSSLVNTACKHSER